MEEYPHCFGTLETVFPMGEDGLRHTPETCFACIYKTDCLKTAMKKTGGLDVREEVVDRAYESGMIGFFERWTKKKTFHQKRQNPVPSLAQKMDSQKAYLETTMKKSEEPEIRKEVVDRAYESGMTGFFERWSKKKSLHQKKKNG